MRRLLLAAAAAALLVAPRRERRLSPSGAGPEPSDAVKVEVEIGDDGSLDRGGNGGSDD